MKIVQNALFRSCGARFGQIAFVSVKVVKIVMLASNSLQKERRGRFSWKLYKSLFSGHAEHVLAKSHFWASKFLKSSHWPKILFKTGKQCSFHENCTKPSFQVMQSTFWPNRICERQSCQNRHAGLKFSPKREKKSIFMKIVQNRLFRSCAARFDRIAFFSVKVVKIVTLAWNSLQNGKTVRFSWKWYKTLFSGHAQHVLTESHFSVSTLSKASHWPQILSKWENCALFMKIVQNALSRSCVARFGQIVFVSVKVVKVVTLASNSVQNRKTLFMKIVQIALFRSCRERFGQIAFLSIKVLKFVTLAWNSGQNFKIVRFPWKLYKGSFQVMRSTFWPNLIFERQSS